MWLPRSPLSVKPPKTPPAVAADPPEAVPPPPPPPTKLKPEPTSNIREIIRQFNSRPKPEPKPFQPVRSVIYLLFIYFYFIWIPLWWHFFSARPELTIGRRLNAWKSTLALCPETLKSFAKDTNVHFVHLHDITIDTMFMCDAWVKSCPHVKSVSLTSMVFEKIHLPFLISVSDIIRTWFNLEVGLHE